MASRNAGAAVKWFDAPQEHDYPAATSYLSLLLPPDQVDALVKRLREAPPASFKAKDVFRASGLPLLGISNLHLERDKEKIGAGEQLSPILLVRDVAHGRVIVADGYHRLCAVYAVDEDCAIPCRIA